jgi:hypothetical protein
MQVSKFFCGKWEYANIRGHAASIGRNKLFTDIEANIKRKISEKLPKNYRKISEKFHPL